MSKVDFIICGAQKSGTTWLVDMLRTNQAVYIPREEVHYFNQEPFKIDLFKYENHFRNASKSQLVGEKTPDYLATKTGQDLSLPNIAARIKEYNESIKLIVILRNPIDRAISAAKHMIRTGRVSPLIDINRLLNKDRIKKSIDFGVLEYGKYSQYLEQYYTLFKTEQILVLEYEQDVRNHPKQALEKVSQFLNISNQFDMGKLKNKSNAFNRSKLSLLIQYNIPRMAKLVRHLDKVMPKAEYTITQSTLDYLTKYYKDEPKELKKLGFTPLSWNL